MGDVERDGRRWRNEAAEYDFLCEIEVARDELDDLLEALRSYRNGRRRWSDDARFALAVAAVNFAAYAEDRNDEGHAAFCEPFTRRFFRCWTQADWESLGRPIERALCEWSGERPRVGAFRYVGPIRHHAGLPLDRVGDLALLVRSLEHDVGWSEVTYAEPDELHRFINRFFPAGTYAASYLHDVAGLRFVGGLCRDLSRLYEERSIDETQFLRLPGYRSDLLRGLLKELRRPPPPNLEVRSGQRAVRPYVALDVDRGELVLRLDPRSVRERGVRCDQLAGPPFDAVLPIDGFELRPLAEYTGTLTAADGDGVRWTARGWNAEADDAWAVFAAEDGRLVASHHDPAPVAAGDYLVALADGVGSAGARWLKQLDLPLVHGRSIGVWSARLGEADDDARLPQGLLVEGAAEPALETWGAAPWSGRSDRDAVFNGNAGQIRLKRWTPRNARRYLITLEVDGRIETLRPDAAGTTDALVLVDLAGRSGVREGIVRLEPVGHHRRSSTPRSLTFACWPAVDVVEPEGRLLASGEAARLRVRHGNRITAFSPVADVEPTADGSIVTTRGSASSLPVSLRSCDGRELRLRVPVPRADLRWADDPGEDVVVVAESLATEASRVMSLRGLPDRSAGLALVDAATGASVEIAGPQPTGRAGRRGLVLLELRDALRNCGFTAGRLAVTDGYSRMTMTDAWFVRLAGLTPAYANGLDLAHVDAPGGATSALHHLAMVAKAAPSADLLDGLNAIRPLAIRKHCGRWMAAAGAVAGAEKRYFDRLVSLVPSMPSSEVDALRGCADLMSRADAIATPGAARTWVEAWDERAPAAELDRPPFASTWGARLAETRERIAAMTRSGDRLIDALRGRKNDATPDALASGIRRYIGRADEAFDAALIEAATANEIATLVAFERERLSEMHAVGPLKQSVGYLAGPADKVDAEWRGVAKQVRAMAALRRLDVADFFRQSSDVTGSLAAGLRSDTAAIGRLLRLQPIGAASQVARTGLAGLDASGRADDRRLATALRGGGFAAWKSAAGICWLGAWLGWRWTHIMRRPPQERAELLKRLQWFADPPSLVPDGRDTAALRAEAEAGTPTACEPAVA